MLNIPSSDKDLLLSLFPSLPLFLPPSSINIGYLINLKWHYLSTFDKCPHSGSDRVDPLPSFISLKDGTVEYYYQCRCGHVSSPALPPFPSSLPFDWNRATKWGMKGRRVFLILSSLYPSFSLSLSYKSYLRSPYWLSLRSKVLKSSGGFCQNPSCPGKDGKKVRATQIHHTSYANLGFPEEEFDLLPLCSSCHYFHHQEEILDKSSSPLPFSPFSLSSLYSRAYFPPPT